jgi:hypothetical protein
LEIIPTSDGTYQEGEWFFLGGEVLGGEVLVAATGRAASAAAQGVRDQATGLLGDRVWCGLSN